MLILKLQLYDLLNIEINTVKNPPILARKRPCLENLDTSKPKKKVGRPPKVSKALDNEPENMSLFCYCQKFNDGKPMIGCDNDLCTIGWFHFNCVGIKTTPINLYCKNFINISEFKFSCYII